MTGVHTDSQEWLAPSVTDVSPLSLKSPETRKEGHMTPPKEGKMLTGANRCLRQEVIRPDQRRISERMDGYIKDGFPSYFIDNHYPDEQSKHLSYQ